VRTGDARRLTELIDPAPTGRVAPAPERGSPKPTADPDVIARAAGAQHDELAAQAHQRQAELRTITSDLEKIEAAVERYMATTFRQTGAAVGVAVTGAIIAGSSAGFLHASHAAWAVVAGCGVMVVLLGMVSTGRWALATAERNGARLASHLDYSSPGARQQVRSAKRPAWYGEIGLAQSTSHTRRFTSRMKSSHSRSSTAVKRSRRRPRVRVTADGHGLVSRAGTRLLADLAERCGLGADLSAALAPIVKAPRRHGPGEVLVDLAVTLAGGGEYVSDLKTLREQPGLFGEVASQPTAWRLLDAIDEALLADLQAARRAPRAKAWTAGLAPSALTLDFDATLVNLHAEKEKAEPTSNKGFGYHPLLAYLDQTGEALAAKLGPGSAGANTAADHVELLDAAVAQLPVSSKADDPERGAHVLVRADSAGATHGFVDAIVAKGFESSIGFDVTEAVRLAITGVPASAWVAPLTQDLEDRDGAGVAEITAYLDLPAWPEGTRATSGREEPHLGANFNLFDPDGWRHHVFITNSADPDVVYPEARHRCHAHVEDHTRDAKATGMSRFPGQRFAFNSAWLLVVLIAQDLLAWAQGLCSQDDLATCLPKRLRYCTLDVAGRLVRTARRTFLRLDAAWPWADQLAKAFERLGGLCFAT
jgi:hypothetical protein